MSDPVNVSRQFSVGDLLLPGLGGGLSTSLGNFGSLSNLASFHRTDSEADFREFLRRIPSSSNLLDGSHQQQPSVLQNSASLGASAGFMPSPGLASAPLDLLQALVQQQQQQHTANAMAAAQAVKLEALGAGGAYLPTINAAELASLNATAANPSTQHQNASAQPAASQAQVPARIHAPAQSQPTAVPSANGTSQDSGPGSSNNDMEHDQWIGGKGDDRRARRMLSNRESARRSRRRKQQHLGQLESEVNVLAEEKRVWAEKIAGLERRFGSAEDENKRLRGENERLLDELRFLRSELKERSSYARRNGHEDETEAQRNKKAKAEQNGGQIMQ